MFTFAKVTHRTAVDFFGQIWHIIWKVLVRMCVLIRAGKNGTFWIF